MAANLGQYGLPQGAPKRRLFPLPAYLWPPGTMTAGWLSGTGYTFSTSAANSVTVIAETQFDVPGAVSLTVDTVTCYVGTANAGAGASINFAAYEIVTPTTRRHIGPLGSALIGSTGAKASTATPLIVPSRFALLARLSNIDTAGTNPAFANMTSAGSKPRWSIRDAIGAAANNAPSLTLSASAEAVTEGRWPSEVSYATDSAFTAMMIQVRVVAAR